MTPGCSLLHDEAPQPPDPKLITLLKIDREATFKNMVDIMDTIVNTARVERFSITPMTDADKKLMAKAG